MSDLILPERKGAARVIKTRKIQWRDYGGECEWIDLNGEEFPEYDRHVAEGRLQYWLSHKFPLEFRITEGSITVQTKK